jgi:3-oxoadipate enol-lactonase/4-carboxymuconolactone decarboxylase
MIAMQLVVDQPDRFSALVLASTRCTLDSSSQEKPVDRVALLREQGPEAAARSSAELIFSSRFRNQNPSYIQSFVSERMAFPKVPLMAAMNAAHGFNLSGELAIYKGPCLVIAGSEDALTKPADVRRVAECIPGSNFVLVEGAGHMIPVEQPTVFFAHLDRFFADHLGPATAAT